MNEAHRTIPPSSSAVLFKQHKNRGAWLLLVVIFLVTGAIGHDPWWKKGEAYALGVIQHFYKTDTWLIPTNAGSPFMEKPPLYYWTAHLFCNLFDSLLSIPDAARMASVASLFLWLSAKTLFHAYPEKQPIAWTCTALFLGTYGIAIFGHALTTDIALLAKHHHSTLRHVAIICAAGALETQRDMAGNRHRNQFFIQRIFDAPDPWRRLPYYRAFSLRLPRCQNLEGFIAFYPDSRPIFPDMADTALPLFTGTFYGMVLG